MLEPSDRRDLRAREDLSKRNIFRRDSGPRSPGPRSAAREVPGTYSLPTYSLAPIHSGGAPPSSGVLCRNSYSSMGNRLDGPRTTP